MVGVLQIELDRGSPVPLYHQVSTAIERSIDAGDLAAGDFLETEVALAARLGISRPTARQALQELVDRGRLVRRRGIGTQVAPDRIRRSVELTSLQGDLERAGRIPTTQILEFQRLDADAELAALVEVEVGVPVVRMRRLRLADGEPLALLANVVPAAVCPDLAELAERGLYESLRLRGVRPEVAQQRIGARAATAEEARVLHEDPGAALLTMERAAYAADGSVIEFGHHLYRASRYGIETTVFAR